MINIKSEKIPSICGVNKTDEDLKNNKIIAFSGYDLSDTEGFSENYCFLTENKLICAVSRPCETDVAYFKGIPEKYIKERSVKDNFTLREYALDEADALKVIKNISGGTLCISKGTRVKKDEKNPSEPPKSPSEPPKMPPEPTAEISVLSFTNRYTQDFMKLCMKRNMPDGENKDKDEEKEREEFCPKCGTRYPERDRKVCPKCLDKRSIFLRTLSFFKPYRLKIAIMLILCVAIAALNLLWPYLNGKILYGKILPKSEEFLSSIGVKNGDFVTALFMVVAAMALTRLTLTVFRIIHGVIIARIVPNVVKDLKCSVFENMGRLSLKFFNSRATGSLLTRVMSDAARVCEFFIDGLPYVIVNVFTICASAAVMFRESVPLTIFSLFAIPVLFFISIKLMPSLWHLYGKRHRAERSMNSRISDNLKGARVVKAFGKEDDEKGRFEFYNKKVKESEINLVRFDNKIFALYSSVERLLGLIIWGAGSYFVVKRIGGFSFGSLIMFTGYVSSLSEPMNFMSFIFRWATDSLNSAQRMYEIIDAVPDISEKHDALSPKTVCGELEIKNLSFGYEPNKPILKNLSLHIDAGEILGIVGRSGAGKSTLVSLISRLYDPDEGDIFLDGINIKDLSFDALRKNVAMVSQETYIFMGSVLDNIRYAKPDASYRDVIYAAALAGAHDFICKMPDGYDTVIGSSGRELSGGERQRISIARAILQNPKILILDEATASVDTETERTIQRSLDFLVKGRTTISIAHRLSTLKNADKLIVIENGEIAENGTHRELIEKKGIYYKLRELQTKALALKGEIAD